MKKFKPFAFNKVNKNCLARSDLNRFLCPYVRYHCSEHWYSYSFRNKAFISDFFKHPNREVFLLLLRNSSKIKSLLPPPLFDLYINRPPTPSRLPPKDGYRPTNKVLSSNNLNQEKIGTWPLKPMQKKNTRNMCF